MTNGPANDEVEKFITEILLKVDVPAVMPPAKVKAPAEVNLLTLEKNWISPVPEPPCKVKVLVLVAFNCGLTAPKIKFPEVRAGI